VSCLTILKTRKEILRLTKKVKPGLVIPELDIEEHTSSAVASANKRVEELEAKMREKEALADLESRRMKLIKNGLIQDENEIEEVEKIMLDKGITNHEAAAEYWQLDETIRSTDTDWLQPKCCCEV